MAKAWSRVKVGTGAIAVAAGLCAAPLHAQNAQTTDPLEKLDAIEKQLGHDRRNVETLTQSAAKLAAEQEALRQKLIDAAASAAARERDLNVVEQRLAVF